MRPVGSLQGNLCATSSASISPIRMWNLSMRLSLRTERCPNSSSVSVFMTATNSSGIPPLTACMTRIQMNEERKITAPKIDNLLRYFGRGHMNPSFDESRMPVRGKGNVRLSLRLHRLRFRAVNGRLLESLPCKNGQCFFLIHHY